MDCDCIDDDGEDTELISGEKSAVKSDGISGIDRYIDASEDNGHTVAFYTFSLAMVSAFSNGKSTLYASDGFVGKCC